MEKPDCTRSKGSESKLAYLGHVLIENRNGLAVDFKVTPAGGTAERDAAKTMADRLKGRKQRMINADRATKQLDSRRTFAR